MKRIWCACLLVVGLVWACGAGAADLLLGAGDVIKISVYGSPDLNLETRIGESGHISFPLLGPVALGGLSTADAEKKIAGLLEQGGFVKKPQVNIIVSSIQSQQVSVLGLVNRPGRYPLEGRRTLIDLLAQAGGANADGGDTVTVIRTRSGKTTREAVDLMTIIHDGEVARNVELAGGDVIYVERAPRFYIYGEVQRPGMYRLERNMTVVQALSAGGGPNARGTQRGLKIKRADGAGHVQFVDAKPDDTLQPDDVLYVPESLF